MLQKPHILVRLGTNHARPRLLYHILCCGQLDLFNLDFDRWLQHRDSIQRRDDHSMSIAI